MSALTLAASSEPSIALVCGLGVGIVFVGLILIIIICKILGFVCQFCSKISDKKSNMMADAPTAAPTSPAQISNRRETVAAISAAIAEDLGTDVSAIRIISIEKM